MSSVWRTYLRERIASLRFTCAWACLGLIPYLMFFTGYGWVGFVISMAYSLVVALTVWLAFGALYGVIAWWQVSRNVKLQPGWKSHALTNVFGTVLGVYFASQFFAWWSGTPLWGRGLYQTVLIGLTFAAFFAFYALYQEARTVALQQQTALAEARYLALENQLQPHFLFNALNSFGELIETDHRNAAQVAFTLSELYRQILANSKTRTATLASEFAIARSYLELEKLRYGDRLRYAIAFDGTDEEIFAPSLVLQTLVENAIKHGIAPALEGGEIVVAVTTTGNGYEMKVSNTGAALRTTALSNGTSTGLTNTQQRLALLYGEGHGFTISTEGAHTVARFTFTGARLD